MVNSLGVVAFAVDVANSRADASELGTAFLAGRIGAARPYTITRHFGLASEHAAGVPGLGISRQRDSAWLSWRYPIRSSPRYQPAKKGMARRSKIRAVANQPHSSESLNVSMSRRRRQCPKRSRVTSAASSAPMSEPSHSARFNLSTFRWMSTNWARGPRTFAISP